MRSICVGENGGAPSIYKDKQSADDENGLPVYYKNGEPVWKEERWVTGESTGPDGKEEGMDEAHVIARLPFGAYILQEEGVPFEQGYVQAPYQGLILEDRKGPQKYFHQDEFTKAAFAKIDIRTQKEIKGAEMTLYRALLDKNGRPETEETGIYKKGEPWAAWISGYAYDDKGVMKRIHREIPSLRMNLTGSTTFPLDFMCWRKRFVLMTRAMYSRSLSMWKYRKQAMFRALKWRTILQPLRFGNWMESGTRCSAVIQKQDLPFTEPFWMQREGR